MLNSLGYDIAATCVLKMPLNPNHPSIHLSNDEYLTSAPVVDYVVTVLYLC